MSDDRLKRALGTIGDAAGQPSSWETVVETTPSAGVAVVRRFPVRRALALVAGAALVVGAGVVLFDGRDQRITPADETTTPTSPSSDPSSTSTSPGPVVASSGWRQVDDLPVGRTRPLVTSIGEDIYVIGGNDTSLCPNLPTVSCAAPRTRLVDGYRLDGDSWRPVATAPEPIDADSPHTVAGESLFVLIAAADDTPNADSSPSLLRYTPSSDAWDRVEVPLAATKYAVNIVAVGDDVLVVPVSDDPGLPTMRYDSDGDEWTTLPTDPLGPSADRQMVAVGESLYLFEQMTSTDPRPLVSAARFDGEEWHRFGPVGVATSGPWLEDEGRLWNPSLGCTDLDGTCVPNGGVYDLASDMWASLPDTPASENDPGALQAYGSVVLARGRSIQVGHDNSSLAVLDLVSRVWWDVDLPRLSPDVLTEVTVVAAGGHLVVAGGHRVHDSESTSDCVVTVPSSLPCLADTQVLSEAWVWTPPVVAVAPEPGAGIAVGWEELPESPLSPRHGSLVQRVGNEIIVIGGDTDLCPPTAYCVVDPTSESPRDGAAYDLTSRTWRTIAAAPVSLRGASSVVLSGSVITGVTDWTAAEPTQQLWRYSPGDDRWDRLPADPTGGVGALVAVGDDLAVVPGSDETVVLPDRLLDLATGEWSDLPDDPLGPSFDRTMVAAGDSLYLFAKDLVPNPGSGARPSVARTARLDLATMTWTVMHESEILTTGPWLVAGDQLVNPSLGCADGGGNSYGRCYPMGGIFDTSTNTWRDLPPIDGLGDEPYGEDAAAIAVDGAVSAVHHVLDRGFWVLDVYALDSGTAAWSQVSWPQGVPPRPVIAVGPDLLLPPAAAWPADEPGRLLGDIWIWRSP
jgi:hypothetical protein